MCRCSPQNFNFSYFTSLFRTGGQTNASKWKTQVQRARRWLFFLTKYANSWNPRRRHHCLSSLIFRNLSVSIARRESLYPFACACSCKCVALRESGSRRLMNRFLLFPVDVTLLCSSRDLHLCAIRCWASSKNTELDFESSTLSHSSSRSSFAKDGPTVVASGSAPVVSLSRGVLAAADSSERSAVVGLNARANSWLENEKASWEFSVLQSVLPSSSSSSPPSLVLILGSAVTFVSRSVWGVVWGRREAWLPKWREVIVSFPAGISCISRSCPDVDGSSLFYEKKGSKLGGFGTDLYALASFRGNQRWTAARSRTSLPRDFEVVTYAKNKLKLRIKMKDVD